MKSTRFSFPGPIGSGEVAPRREPAGLRVLIAENYTDNAQTTATLLRLFGHEVRIVTDGPSALQDAPFFDVVLLEIVLPRMNGWEVARRLREQGNADQPILIAVTGLGQEADRCRSLEAGIDLHLLKPVDPGFLRQVLQRIEGEGWEDDDVLAGPPLPAYAHFAMLVVPN